jgi:uncharacterized delta-60 repeat protein
MRERAASGFAVAALGLGLFAAVAIAASGDLDPSFDGDGVATIDWGGTDVGRGLVVQPDGKIVVVGQGFGVPVDLGLSRLNTNGTLDNGFSTDGKLAYALGGDEDGSGVTLLPDGKIVAVGHTVRTAPAVERAVVTRTNPDGTPDSTWGAAGSLELEYGGTEDRARDVVVQPDQKIVTVGWGGPGSDIMVTRLTTGAVPDASFGVGGTRVVDLAGTEQGFSIARQADGKLVFGGLTTTGTDHLVVGRLNADGSPDTSFNGTGIRTLGSGFGDVGRDVAVQADGKILVLGFGGVDFKLTRLNPNGSVDTGFGSGGTATIDFGAGDIGQSLLLLGNGKIAFSGQTGGDRGAVALLQPGGTLDTTFSGDGKVTLPPSIANAAGLGVEPDGKLVVAGPSDSASGNIGVARIEGDFSPGPGGPGGPGGSGQGGGQAAPRCGGKRATIVGTRRSERLKGTRRNDVIVALGGNDKIAGGRGNDIICAGDGNDTVSGESGKDRLFGQNGKDRLSGGDGNDTVDGGSANDKITGGSGKDRLIGGSGKDNLAGGGGRDSCNGGSGRDAASCEKQKSI